MAERDRYDRLDQAITAALAGSVPSFEPELASMLLIAGDLRDLPDPRFAARLRNELFRQEEKNMNATATETAAPVVTSIRPYLIVNGAAQLIEFLQQTLGAEELLRVPRPEDKIMHAELRIGDSILELADASEQWPGLAAPLHVYLQDVDDAYARAMAAGATSLFPPTDQPYGDREAGIVDPTGIQWFLARHLATPDARRPGFSTVTSGFRAENADAMARFLQQAFGAVEIERSLSPAGLIQHAELRVGESLLELSEAHGSWGPTTGAFHIFVADCDAIYARALQAGAVSLAEPEEKPYGERSASIEDPFGNQWYVATRR